MASANYPQGMVSYNNRLPIGGYKTWKGKGIFSNPVGITAGNIRPFTNGPYSYGVSGDGQIYPVNDTIYKHGSARPIKHYRRGISVPLSVFTVNASNPVEIIETKYYSNREVKSSVQDYMVAQMQDQPGRFIVKENTLQTNQYSLDKDCTKCNGVGIISNWQPITNLTEKPQPDVTNGLLCCNQQRKAIRRVLPASTNLKKNYYTTNSQYLFNRCQTYDQRAFNFFSGVSNVNALKAIEDYPSFTEKALDLSKPGDPLSYLNLYVANCNPNGEIAVASYVELMNQIAKILFNTNLITEVDYTKYKSSNFTSVDQFITFLNGLSTSTKELALAKTYEILAYPYNGAPFTGPTNPKGCKLVVYKPNNPQYAQQGAVSSSTRILKLKANTIDTTAAINKKKEGLNKAGNLTYASYPTVPFVYKSKVPTCNPGVYIKNGNPKTCFRNSNDVANVTYI